MTTKTKLQLELNLPQNVHLITEKSTRNGIGQECCKCHKRRNRAVSETIASIVLIAATVVLGAVAPMLSYFVFQTNETTKMQQAVEASNQNNHQKGLRSRCSRPKHQRSSERGEHFYFLSVSAVEIVAAVVFNSLCNGGPPPAGALSAELLSIPISPDNKASISTGYNYASQAGGATVCVEVVTSLGNVASLNYPIPTTTSTNPIVNILNEGPLGDLYLLPQSYSYYNVTSCSGGAGYCLSKRGSGFMVPDLSSGHFAFSVSVVNLNSKSESVILDQFTALYESTLPSSNGKQILWAYYITTNSTTTLQAKYSPIVLQYNKSQTLLFASASCLAQNSGPTAYNAAPCGGFAPQSGPISNGNTAAPPIIDTNFILAHGWEYLVDVPPVNNFNLNLLSYVGGTYPSNYGQNLPYTSTLWY